MPVQARPAESRQLKLDRSPRHRADGAVQDADGGVGHPDDRPPTAESAVAAARCESSQPSALKNRRRRQRLTAPAQPSRGGGRSSQRRPAASRNSWTWRIATAPSPTAEATRLTEPLRTSPTANTPSRRVP